MSIKWNIDCFYDGDNWRQGNEIYLHTGEFNLKKDFMLQM